MQYMWDMVNGFQLMSHMPLLPISLPANMIFLLGFINKQISNFDAIDLNVLGSVYV